MSVYTIRSNLDRGTQVLVPDLGFLVPGGGGSVTFSDDGNIAEINQSLVLGSLATLTNDSAYVGGTDASDHTLVIDIDGDEVPPGEGDRAVAAVPLAMEEQDGVPSVLAVTKIRVANGALTNEGNGVVSLAGGGGGGTGTLDTVTDGSTTVNNPTTLQVAETGTVSEPAAGTAQIAIRPAVDYAGQFSAAAVTTGDIGTGKWGLFHRTTDNKRFHVWNHSGTLYAVELTVLT